MPSFCDPTARAGTLAEVAPHERVMRECFSSMLSLKLTDDDVVVGGAVQIVTGVVVGVLLLVATVIVVIVVYRKSGYVLCIPTHSLIADMLDSSSLF